ncbi:hypothetical protein ACFLTH_00355 [Bacteroidota bacterium]
MRKLLHISFAVIYLLLTTGFTLTFHYCGGEISDISVVRTAGDEDPCGCNGAMCQVSCCKDETVTVKLADYHSPVLSQIFKISDYSSTEYSDTFTTQPFSEHENFYYIIVLADSNPPPIYISNCSFLN